MSSGPSVRAMLTPWAGLIVGVIAWATAHQFGADGMFDDCAAFDPAPVLAVPLIGIIATAIAGSLSWRAFGRSGAGDAQRVISIISVGMAALFCLALFYPMLAALIIPPCFQ